MSRYVRPRSLQEAVTELGAPGAVALAGGTDLAGQIDRGLRSPDVLVDLQAAGLTTIEPDQGGVSLGAMVTLSQVAASGLVAPYRAVTEAAAAAASPLLRNVGTVAGNLCQHTRCWYYRGVEWNCWLGGGDTCYAQIGVHHKHNLQPGNCISAHPSDLAPALVVCGATVVVQSPAGERGCLLSDLYRTPTADNRSFLTLAADELVTAVRLPAPPDRSAYLRLGERQAFSFPLLGLAAARRGTEVRMAAAGVASVPLEIDPAEPLAALPGNPQSSWKRDALLALVDRAFAAIS